MGTELPLEGFSGGKKQGREGDLRAGPPKEPGTAFWDRTRDSRLASGLHFCEVLPPARLPRLASFFRSFLGVGDGQVSFFQSFPSGFSHLQTYKSKLFSHFSPKSPRVGSSPERATSVHFFFSPFSPEKGWWGQERTHSMTEGPSSCLCTVSSQAPTRPGGEAQRLECANTLPKPASCPPPALLLLCSNRSGRRPGLLHLLRLLRGVGCVV